MSAPRISPVSLPPRSIESGVDISGLNLEIDASQEYNYYYFYKLAKRIAAENANNSVAVYGQTPLVLPSSKPADQRVADNIKSFIDAGRENQGLEFPATFLIPIFTREDSRGAPSHYELMAVRLDSRESRVCDAHIVDSSKIGELDPSHHSKFLNTSLPAALERAGLQVVRTELHRPLLQYAVGRDEGSTHCGAYVLQNMRNICEFGFEGAVVGNEDVIATSGDLEAVQKRSLEFRALDVARFALEAAMDPDGFEIQEGLGDPEEFLPAGVSAENYDKFASEVLLRSAQVHESELGAALQDDDAIEDESMEIERKAVSQELIINISRIHHNKAADPLLMISGSQSILQDFCEIAKSVLSNNPDLDIKSEEFRNIFSVELSERLGYNQGEIKKSAQDFSIIFDNVGEEELSDLLILSTSEDFEEVILEQAKEDSKGLMDVLRRGDEVRIAPASVEIVDDEKFARQTRCEELFIEVAQQHNLSNQGLPFSESMSLVKDFCELAAPIFQNNPHLSNASEEEFQNILYVELAQKFGSDKDRISGILKLCDSEHVEELSKNAQIGDLEKLYSDQLDRDCNPDSLRLTLDEHRSPSASPMVTSVTRCGGNREQVFGHGVPLVSAGGGRY